MERLLRTNSGCFGPVNIKNVYVKSLNRNTAFSLKQQPRNVSAENHRQDAAAVSDGKRNRDAAVSDGKRNRDAAVSEVESQPWKGYRDCVSSQAMIENHGNFKKSGAPARVMTWTDGAWVEVPGDALALVKEAFSLRSPMAEIEVDGNECIFDFFRMLMIDVASGLQRSIAWIDVNGGCFFPKFFVDESLVDSDDEHICDDNDETSVEIPRIEIEIKLDSSIVNNNNNKNNKNVRNSADSSDGGRLNERNGDFSGGDKRKREHEDTAESSCNSGTKRRENRSVKRQRSDEAQWPNVRVLREGERGYEAVKNMFMSGMSRIDPGVKITAVHQFNKAGHMEKARWEVFRKQMEIIQSIRGGNSNLLYAWHGTSRKGLSEILAHGFGRPSTVSGAQAHGVGVYLSPSRLPHMSAMFAEADDNGEKHILLCQVVLGKLEKVEAGSQQFPSSTEFDNGVDDLTNPKWFVVWSSNMNTHIIPECVVSYKCSDRKNGTLQGGESLQWIPNGPKPEAAKIFFSRLGRLLPPQKVEQLKDLCMSLKAGTLAKDLFIKQLRSVVGNEMLQSAIHGIEGSRTV